MFTGLIKNTAQVIKKEKQEGGYNFIVAKPATYLNLEIGESIAVDGICLTLSEYDQNNLKFFVGLETLAKTNFLSLKETQKVNLERSLTLQDRLGGHLVSGHVDGVALVTFVESQGECFKLKINVPQNLSTFVVNKGSLCINGVSLTINQINNTELEFFLIPETLKQTNLSSLVVGTFVNIECDQMVKVLVERINVLFKDFKNVST